MRAASHFISSVTFHFVNFVCIIFWFLINWSWPNNCLVRVSQFWHRQFLWNRNERWLKWGMCAIRYNRLDATESNRLNRQSELYFIKNDVNTFFFCSFHSWMFPSFFFKKLLCKYIYICIIHGKYTCCDEKKQPIVMKICFFFSPYFYVEGDRW